MAPKTERRELEQSTRNKMVGINTAGMSGREIANQFGLVPSTVNKVIKRYRDSSSTENRTRSGRPKNLTERDTRHLVSNVKSDRRSTLHDITNEMPSKVSISTVRRALHEHSFNSRIAAKKPFISATNQAKRLAFALKHQNLTVDDWKHVLWTDESPFEIGKIRDQFVPGVFPLNASILPASHHLLNLEVSLRWFWVVLCGVSVALLLFYQKAD